MDQSQQPQQPQQRELVFCHQCENEWYRDEHGIICPECQSDFTEIIEQDHDPRDIDDEDAQLPGGNHEWYAPDPDEDDIENLHWQDNGPGQPPGGRITGNVTRTIRLGGPNGQNLNMGGGMGGGLMDLLGPALQGLLGGQQRPQQPQGEGQERGTPGEGGDQQGPQQFGNGGTFTRTGQGPGYSFTITTSSNLHPRNANGPQPMNPQPDNIERMMAQMFMNIGAMPGQGMRAPPGPMFMGMGGGGAPPVPINDLFQLLGMPPGGVHGDAVYSQEALDRIITQLMEQHQTGNAPGPATEEAIESLPKRPITQKDVGESGSADCSICMDEAAIGSIVTELPCGHWFHHDCVKAWLKEHDTCPQCRQGIMPKDQSADTNRPREPSQAPLNDMHSPEYHRPSVPGEYPFPRADSSGAGGSGGGDGSRTNPFRVSESPERRRQGESSGGIFSRMREAFSPSGNPPSNNGGNPNNNNDTSGAR
ncbi:hypothetical protein PRZ48_002780 [Zasmidium cellare]|uniref:RING-type domain-containing protein n=1 Tax=Zasmidium cellare TaxID=395010 RepID=A0ABR0EVF3_ZASCE|nr:hypothetical protein PRZ48_002780 [Zasmidium cellare]